MISDKLRTGLATLQKRGWKKGRYGTPTRGPVCMIGALPIDAIGACRPYLKQAIQDAYGPLWNVNGWQDTPGRRFVEVERVFLDAIVLAQADELVAA